MAQEPHDLDVVEDSTTKGEWAPFVADAAKVFRAKAHLERELPGLLARPFDEEQQGRVAAFLKSQELAQATSAARRIVGVA